ncbi:OLC1v1018996C1 [Oldenlandia corymbosa var. corymbosa]|uniref:OLC1v1018996C1 n=1 Tax=Oldenlandia corymbosa var. corymbosa TaxID=529605 RepID=A0AAV1EDD0_OLDCO|nr:OLC1v1018996C1 [Oldenlandia corymbosa var. corymbosa]
MGLNKFCLQHALEGFFEGALLIPGRPLKTEKAANFDAVQWLERMSFRMKKSRLKVEKEKLEQQLKTMNNQLRFMRLYLLHLLLSLKHLATCWVLVIGYPGVAMLQFMPPAAVDTSQNHVLRPRWLELGDYYKATL